MRTLEFTDEQIGLIQHALGIAEKQFADAHKELAALTEVRHNPERERLRAINNAYLQRSFQFADLNASIEKELIEDKQITNH